MALTLHDSKIISWKKIMNVEDLTVISRAIFLKHHFDYIMVSFSDQKKISSVGSQVRLSISTPHLIFTEHLPPIQLSYLPYNEIPLTSLLFSEPVAPILASMVLLIFFV